MPSRIAETLDVMSNGVGRPSTPVESLGGLAASAAALAAASPGDLLTLGFKFDDGQVTVEVFGAPREYQHPWYPDVRVIECEVRKPRSRARLTLTIHGDDGGGCLLGGRGLGDRIASIRPAA